MSNDAREADVIVIGAGGAGLIAAVNARLGGARVLVLAKSRAGYACCTAYARGGFTLGIEGYAPERHRVVTWETGRQLSLPALLETLTQDAPEAVPRLRDFGVRMELGRGRASVAPYAERPLLAGAALTLPLVRYAREIGVLFRERVLATRLLVGEDGCAGVEVVDFRRGAVEELRAGAVVVATGGAGAIYGRTDNPRTTTGDGYRLLAAAGAPLLDMEFVQFYPLGFADPGVPPYFLELGVTDEIGLSNGRGERFWPGLLSAWGVRSGREANLFARDRAAVAIAREVRATGEVRVHFEELPAPRWEDREYARLRRFLPNGPAPARVAPTQHYFTGGVPISADGETPLPGVYACGEVAGGIDGASRVGGNAFSSLAVFGRRAGRAAARWARSESRGAWTAHSWLRNGWTRGEGASTLLTDATAGSAKAKMARWAEGGRLDPDEARRQVNAIADAALGPLRDEAGLRQADRQLGELQAELAGLSVSGTAQWQAALEAENLLFVARVVTSAALARAESRGVHFREDHPTEDEAWRRHIALRRGHGDEIEVTLGAVEPD